MSNKLELYCANNNITIVKENINNNPFKLEHCPSDLMKDVFDVYISWSKSNQINDFDTETSIILLSTIEECCIDWFNEKIYEMVYEANPELYHKAFPDGYHINPKYEDEWDEFYDDMMAEYEWEGYGEIFDYFLIDALDRLNLTYDNDITPKEYGIKNDAQINIFDLVLSENRELEVIHYV